MTICVGASAGGHMNELQSILNHMSIWPVEPSVYITTQEILAGELKKKGKTYVVGECNRYHPLEAIRIFFTGFKIMLTDKPDVIITTGSMPIAMICLVAKLFQKKVVWIDSVVNIGTLSLSGRLMYHFADLFLTQWPENVDKFPKAECAGAVL